MSFFVLLFKNNLEKTPLILLKYYKCITFNKNNRKENRLMLK